MTKAEIHELYKLMFTEYQDIIGIAELQSMLRISRHAAYALIGDGYIPAVKVANAFRIPKINVINYVLSEKKAPSPEA